MGGGVDGGSTVMVLTMLSCGSLVWIDEGSSVAAVQIVFHSLYSSRERGVLAAFRGWSNLKLAKQEMWATESTVDKH